MPFFSRNAPDPAAVVRQACFPLTEDADVRRIVAEIGDSRLVLIGEASHGTHDFYALRAQITRALIAQRGFAAVAIEGDWPDAFAVHRYVTTGEGAADAVDALAGFERFPTWMWRNTAVAEFLTWLREHNATQPDRSTRVGFYGLDLYSLHASMRAVVAYLEPRDPAAARAARESYGCFEDFGDDPQEYAWANGRLDDASCAEAVARELVSLEERRARLVRQHAGDAAEEYFSALQNARLAANAERYYREMNRGRVASWNLRDTHMAETLEALRAHLIAHGRPPKIVVWAHNSHLGDARATEAGDDGEVTLGQLVRERHGDDARLIGLTTYAGTVMAATDWGQPGRLRRVRPAFAGSCEHLFHEVGIPRFLLPMSPGSYVHGALAEPRLERAIGVIYRPDTERWSHYFHARLSRQFDLLIHLDETHAVTPLGGAPAWDRSEAPETFPSGV